MLFFVFLGDAILSDWVPGYMQESLGSPLLMGIVFSFSSLVGFLADLIFPQYLQRVEVRRMVFLAIVTSLFFGVLLLGATWWPVVGLFLVAMAVWGVYYEFLGFGGQAFVAQSIPSHFRAGAWSVLGAFRGLAYFLGPIIGSSIALNRGNKFVVLMAMFFVVVGLLMWVFSPGKKRDLVIDEKEVRVNLFIEVKHWGLLLKSVWPVVTISLMLGLLDSTFWTTGTVLSDELAANHAWGGMFLPFYELPMIVIGLVVAKLGIYKGKKKLAEFFMLISGIALVFLSLSDAVWLTLLIAFVVGMATSICWPLKDAIFSDMVSRMGHEGKHMIGLSGSTVSAAYVFGPIISGAIANAVGEKNTFVVIGLGLILVSLVLLVVTPRKMRLSQLEINSWE